MNCVTIKVESDFEKDLLSCVSKAFVMKTESGEPLEI